MVAVGEREVRGRVSGVSMDDIEHSLAVGVVARIVSFEQVIVDAS
jgi:hypothetical protein